MKQCKTQSVLQHTKVVKELKFLCKVLIFWDQWMQDMCGSHHTSFYILQTEYKFDSKAITKHCDIHEGGFTAGYAFWDCVSLS